MEFTLLFAVLTAGGAMFVAARILRRRLTGVQSPVDTLLAAAGIGLISGRVAAMLLDGVNPLGHPMELILVRAGVETMVAGPIAVGTLMWLTRKHLPSWMDALAPVAVAGVAGWHGGCVWRGTCLGTASDLPWAYGIPGSDVTRHPVELYAAIAMLAVAAAVTRLPLKPWLATSAGVAGLAAVRLVTEPLRPSLSGGPTTYYLAAMVIGIAIMIAGPRLPVIERRAVDPPTELKDPL